jgi:predicted nucleotidyltransferase
MKKNEDEFAELIDEITKKFSPDKLILFGSRARGTENENSDYDVLFLKNGVNRKREIAQELYKLLKNKYIAVDFIVETPEGYLKKLHNPYMIYKEISETGKLIYERK